MAMSEWQDAADLQVRELIRDHWGSQALEELIADCLSRLAETHGIYLCEARYEEVEVEVDELYYGQEKRYADCAQCEWRHQPHLTDDYLCLNCRAIMNVFKDGPEFPRDYDVYTSEGRDVDGNVVWIDNHRRFVYGGTEDGAWEREIMYTRRPIPDSYEPACRPVNTLAYEYLHYKADVHDLESKR